MTDERFMREGEAPSNAPVAILRTFALQNKVKVLAGLTELSYVAGREGDDELAWADEADEAIIDAFAKSSPVRGGSPRSERLGDARAALTAAFRGGAAQREIDIAVSGRARIHDYAPGHLREGVIVPDRALAVARAHATIYLSEVEFQMDQHPSAIEAEIGYVAAKVAQWHPVTDAEAAYCALKAFEEAGLATTFEAAAWALDRAQSGRAEREAQEAKARARGADITNATAGLFGVQE
jgi:hypothetical protein